MKKLIALLMVLAMSLSLVACAGGIDKQPAIDAYDKAYTAFNELVTVINESPDEYTDEVKGAMTGISNAFLQHKEILEGDQELTEEAMADMIAWYGEVEAWVASAKTDLGIE